MDVQDFEKLTDEIGIDPARSAGPLWWLSAALFLIFGPYMIGCVIWLIQASFHLTLASVSIAPFFVIYLIFFMQPQDRTFKVLTALACLPFAIGLYVWAGANFKAPVQKVPNLSSVSGGYVNACGEYVESRASLVRPEASCPQGSR